MVFQWDHIGFTMLTFNALKDYSRKFRFIGINNQEYRLHNIPVDKVDMIN